MRSDLPMDQLDSLSIRDLRAVIALAERLHFGRAAEDLSITDPLETELTVDINELFDFVKASKLPHWAPGMTGTPAARTIAARLLYPPSELNDQSWATTLIRASDDALESHGFDSDARRALRAGDWKAALEARAARVQPIVSELVAQRAHWGENDRPSLEYLAVDSTQP